MEKKENTQKKHKLHNTAAKADNKNKGIRAGKGYYLIPSPSMLLWLTVTVNPRRKLGTAGQTHNKKTLLVY